MLVNLQRVQHLIEKLESISSSSDELTRLAFTTEDEKAHNVIIELCRQYNLSVKRDAIGNLFIRKAGKEDHLPAVAFGSHIDTVVNAGKFDGPLGVIGGLEILLQLCEQNIQTRYPLELIVFTCEESSRFNFATLGSKVMCGVINQEKLSRLRDKQGNTLAEAMAKIGMDFNLINQAKRDGKEFKCFFELHIEQGPRLANENKTIGVVTGIAAPIRGIVRINGQADHSGATAMHYRHDALLGGAELSLAIEQAAINAKHSTVATVGNLTAKPGVMNVVPGYCELLVDIRGIHTEARDSVLAVLQKEIENVAEKRGLSIEFQLISKDNPVVLPQAMIEQIENAAKSLGYSYEIMPSGAGHDAMHMATLCPTGMIFVPSHLGISHNPLEFTEWKDIEAGIKVLQKVVLEQAEIC
ncbi:Zn-dependent hydrolase [Rodentibacter caecimuris]|uniref:Zn-dependent hydrolase n=1 Tax=Rodentibacter caecimuris TaxID=1796644 RepID=A0AAJ3K497_9PAST|nr:Zn-dependent hydrolase [Rodentibacter heylii]AOF53085.1 N-carbamoyl-L-amino acid hydrolase [Pasteurellaceae bacterium NI1060]OOF72264.1 Zn-dependent hydrolase [Rodentibacter heylii]OOF73465.1 Zn-dependent hydrolase [Rodentibacter heylii]OOF74447.1 Zn-dependent hydrolase [Rodentibacter heylii]